MNAEHIFLLPSLIPQNKQWLCPSWVPAGADFGDGGGDEDGGTDGGSDGGSDGEGIGKTVRTRASRSPHIDLVNAMTEEDRQTAQANLDAQRELAKKKKED